MVGGLSTGAAGHLAIAWWCVGAFGPAASAAAAVRREVHPGALQPGLIMLFSAIDSVQV